MNDSHDHAVATTLRFLERLFDSGSADRVGFRLWDGTMWPDDRPRDALVVLKHPGALRRMLVPGTELALGEAYLYDDFDVEGDLEKVFEMADVWGQEAQGLLQRLRAARELLQLPSGPERKPLRRGPARLRGKRHSIERDREAVRYHYDVSNEFYALWLDQRMVYSCAYFERPDEPLDKAQERKLDYICRKLRLQPGQRLLDIGCGWGGLVIHAAQRYGVEAIGITLSEPQAELANERIAQAGLQDRCRVLVQDYREASAPDGGYDALASVGMFEHVGEEMLPVYFARAWELLKPGGVFLNHGIARRIDLPPRDDRSFSDAYVFPDGELTPISTTLRIAEEAGFEVRDVENLREHYVLTLRNWVRRLEAHHEEALQYVDEGTYRVWRLFMSGSAYGFRVGRLQVFQTLLSKPGPGGESGLPLTRADWYVHSA
ncbi:MAG: class I SAM-dependent methyltransferase [Anaerolineae bacterium]